MSATFGSPVSAVLLAIELLLFELGPRSLVPVALASATAAGVRAALVGSAPVFAMPAVPAPPLPALAAYVLLGAGAGVLGVGVTRAVYAIEDGFERLPVPWPLWPAMGGLVVGAVGWAVPRTLGVGYDNIDAILSGRLAGAGLVVLCLPKLLSWAVALGSGTSGGTLAPLLTFGGGAGALAGEALARAFPHAGFDPRTAALVGMAALFAGASRAALTSVVFALEVTLQPAALPALLAGCAAAHVVSCLLMRESLMTEKIARRGVRVPAEVTADYLARVLVRDAAAPRWSSSTPPGRWPSRGSACGTAPEGCRTTASRSWTAAAASSGSSRAAISSSPAAPGPIRWRPSSAAPPSSRSGTSRCARRPTGWSRPASGASRSSRGPSPRASSES